ncbi:MAG: serine protease Do, partial [Gammaproteobacteria bacterium]
MKSLLTLRTLASYALVLSLALALGPATAQTRMGLPDFTGLVERSSAAVVNISTTSKRRAGVPDFIPRDDPRYELYRRFFEGLPQQRDGQSLGSGFIISDDGFIITNNHVVVAADKIIVRLNDRREFEATLVGADERSDVAVLKIDATGLPAAKLGLTRELKVGAWVLAIGSPFGFDYSVTAGIVS